MDTDSGLENLLGLHGEIIAFDNGTWAKFVAIRVDPDEARPHGISYSLTLHDRDGRRIFWNRQRASHPDHEWPRRQKQPGAGSLASRNDDASL